MKDAAYLSEKIRSALSTRKRVTLSPGPVPAAVLVPLFVRDNECRLLVTKRAEHLNHHRGEFSFPGGVFSPTDQDLRETALRETREEIGICPSDVDVLGALDDIYSIHNYLVTPYVGFLSNDYPMTINSSEVDRVVEIPLSHLLRPETVRTEEWTWRGRPHAVRFFRYGTDEIWGLTAAILMQFLVTVFSYPCTPK